MTRLPALIAHADWSKDPRKRWVAVARCSGEGGRYDLEATRPVGNTGALLRLLREAADGGPVLMGFDFPIGLPMAYARRVGVTSFRELLPKLGCEEPWSTFFELARKPGEIGLGRPFYPWAPGGTRRADLVSALGLMSTDDLYRECERRVESPSAKRPSETRGASGRDPTPAVKSRAAASPLFWTLGAQQVGRAAIVGWREVLQPALKDAGSDSVGLWPFDGALGELLETRRTVISETYPAAAYLDLGLTEDGRRWSKRRSADRRHHGAKLAQWADRNEVTLGSEARAELESGFGEGADGEDRFDAFVGLLGMVKVVMSEELATCPLSVEVRQVEGWILGAIERSSGWQDQGLNRSPCVIHERGVRAYRG